MERKRLINRFVLFLITMFIFMGKFDVTKFDIYQSLVIAISSLIIAFGIEHILTLNVIKQYDDMKRMNPSGCEPLIVMVKVLYATAMIITLMDADMFIDAEGIPIIFSAQGLLITIILLDNVSIYVGNKYMYFRNYFIKLEDIASFTQTEVKAKSGKETNKVEVIIETKQGKKYAMILTKLASANLGKLESRFSNNTNLA